MGVADPSAGVLVGAATIGTVAGLNTVAGPVRLRPPGWHRDLAFGVGLLFASAAGLLAPFGLVPTLAVGLAVGLGPAAIAFRGRAMLRRARGLAGDPTRALAAFEALARRTSVGAAVRCDASAHAAVLRLERGELEAALRWLALPLRDSQSTVRARTPRVGYYGEAVRGVLGRLFPEAGLQVLGAAALRPCAESTVHVAYEGVAELVAALRVLEAGRRPETAAVAQAWAEVDRERFAGRTPLLYALVLGVVARADPSVRPGLRARLQALPVAARVLALRRFPELSPEPGAGYRVVAREQVVGSELQTAPVQLQSLTAARSGLCRWLPVAPEGPGMAFLWVWMIMIGTSASWPALAAGGVVGALWLAASQHRRDRVRPLIEAGIVAPARLRELALMASRSGPVRWGRPAPHPFDRGELMLVVGLARAEAAMREGDLAAAREQVGWWFSGTHASAPTSVDLHAIASSALRMATLLGFSEAASYLAASARPGDSPVGRPRSGHGNAPRAMWLARALCSALGGDDAAAARALDRAATSRAVVLDAFEMELYGALAARLSSHGHIIPRALQPLIPSGEPRDWVTRVWPAVAEVAQPRLGTAACRPGS